MPFLLNCWYAAGWDHDLADAPIARTFLGEPVVLYRTSDGTPAALRDMCPHRFAPLSLGKVEGDTLQCPYHGLVFDRAGTCIANPNGRGARPQALSVRSYPVSVSNGMVWIWPGDPAAAADVAPPFYDFLDDPEATTVSSYLHVAANYELVTDNLMDLSHVEYLHPFIAGAGDFEDIEMRTEQMGERVSAFHFMPGHAMTPQFAPFFDDDVTVIDGRAHLHWEAPGNMMLDVGAIADVAGGERRDVALPAVHLLTPESETSTHYFWAVSRTALVDSEEYSRVLKEAISYAFAHEDEPMVRAVAERMAGRSLFDMKPALLPQDEAAVRARRVLARRIAGQMVKPTGVTA